MEKRSIQKTRGIEDFWRFYSKIMIANGWEYHKESYLSEHYITKGDERISCNQVSSLIKSFFFSVTNALIMGKKFRFDLGLGYIKIIKKIKDGKPFLKSNLYKNKDKIDPDSPQVKIIWCREDDVAKRTKREKGIDLSNLEYFEFVPARSDASKGKTLGFKNRLVSIIRSNPTIVSIYDTYMYKSDFE